MKLEDELGAKLFHRKGLTVALTPFGEAFLPRAKAILQQLHEAQSEIREMVEIESGRVMLGASPTLTPFFLPSVLSGFLKQHPLIELQVKEDCPAVLMDWLRTEIIDLAIMPLPVNGDGLVTVELMKERLFAVVNENYLLQGEDDITLEQLSAAPLLLFKDAHCVDEHALAALGTGISPPRIVLETGCFLTVVNMVKAGLGVAILPDMPMSLSSGCRLIAISGEASTRTIGLVEARGSYQTRARRLLASFFQAYCREHAGS